MLTFFKISLRYNIYAKSSFIDTFKGKTCLFEFKYATTRMKCHKKMGKRYQINTEIEEPLSQVFYPYTIYSADLH